MSEANSVFTLDNRILTIVSAVALSFSAWVAASISSMAEDVAGMRTELAVLRTSAAVVEGNRFTVADALQMRREMESGPPNAGALTMFQIQEARMLELERAVAELQRDPR